MTKLTKIRYDWPTAASIQTVTGWVSSDGRFWGKDEDLARYAGSTHRLCKNNPEHGEHIINEMCEQCYEERKITQWESFPKREYDESPICTLDGETFFFGKYEILDWLEENNVELNDAKFLFCDPNYLSEIDNSYWADELPEETDLDGEVQDALDKLNFIIEKQGPCSYSPGSVAVIFPKNFLDQ